MASDLDQSALDQKTIDTVLAYDAEQRVKYLLTEVVNHQAVWILVDEHGCVMLNTDDEDCVPVWPHREFAEHWATGDWSHCNAQAIPLDTWLQRWTTGLEDDELAVVVFPDPEQGGVILYPGEFEAEIKRQRKR